jgi:hypothetical protein
VERHILFAQCFTKLIVAVTLDSTELPGTLHASPALPAQVPCDDAEALLCLHLPAPESTDPLLALYQQASHAYINQRKEAIGQAAAMLQSYFRLNILTEGVQLRVFEP